MRHVGNRRGQSMAEYAVLFAIVIGAAVAMQQFVKTRLQATVAAHARNYQTQASVTGATLSGNTRFDPTRLSRSSSGTDQIFVNAGRGTVESTGGSETEGRKSVSSD